MTQPSRPAPRTISPELAELLCCPVCHGTLDLSLDPIPCGQCGASYVWRGGIPDLVPPDSSNTESEQA
jgi:uncharacterized protein YbaR (Trm112 family)